MDLYHRVVRSMSTNEWCIYAIYHEECLPCPFIPNPDSRPAPFLLAYLREIVYTLPAILADLP